GRRPGGVVPPPGCDARGGAGMETAPVLRSPGRSQRGPGGRAGQAAERRRRTRHATGRQHGEPMKTVITYGTFDILHIGHINLLRRARALGDRLVVGLSSGEFNGSKHRTSLLNYEIRKAVLEAIRYVDEVIPENSWEEEVDDNRRSGTQVCVMESEWEGKFDFLREFCEVHYLSRTD